MQKIHKDQYFLEGLISNNHKVVQEIYAKFSDKIKRHILNNNGSVDDAGDVFQECLIDLYNQAKYKDLKLSCPFEPFFLLMCKRKWLNALKKKAIIPVTNNEEDLLNISEDVFLQAEELEAQQEQSELYLKMFQKLSERCQEIISLSLTDQHQEKIAEDLGVTYGYLRKKKSECMASLILMIRKEQG
ncbi:sigma-70 family RNA polymerase sigma factor [Pedobacter sp. SD-b]|uniref:Sigma-70 family RNA polymerase sigma factor n=1 Tax=Pedobacter segetis TaxID=2793069 RepID=A0ABS1BI06_9SPHI|nr:sigma-70 family RNA polymerase sigma factor [Pedobacter segetis]MBK0382495.1 sigma-70 family RNA polymerase sigma factor [Pedobacter segetis]